MVSLTRCPRAAALAILAHLVGLGGCAVTAEQAKVQTPVAARPALERLGRELGLELSRIGRIVAATDAGPQCSLVDERLQPYALPPGVELKGFDHFA